jgi:ABC-type antimicrobial peptide transport system permease subunit
MFSNYIKIAWRNLLRNKSFSIINILGLTIGLACSLLILLWVQDERGVDNFHKNSDRLFLVYEKQFIDGKKEGGYYTPGVLGNELKRVVPEIEYATNFFWFANNGDNLTFEAENKIMKFVGCYGDSDFFKMMSYPLIKGTTNEALNSPVSLAISEKMAKAFFGSVNAAYGKTMRFENDKELQVTAIFADLPQNVSTRFDWLVNWSVFLGYNSWAKEWGNNGPNTLVMLRKDADPKKVEKKIRKFLDNYNKEQSASFRIELGLQRFGDYYLNNIFKDGEIVGGRSEYVRLFSIVAIFILIIACINFMNLTTARSARRAKEIGVRKVAGAIRPALVRQFMSEAMMITALSVVLALVLVAIVLPFFNQLTGKQITLPVSESYFWISVLVLTAVTGILSGSYPAVFLSGFKPITVLKGTLKFSNSSALFRKGLVVFQFVLSFVLISATILVSRQVNYIQTRNLGFDRENLVVIPIEGELRAKYQLYKQQVVNENGIKSVSRIGETPTDVGSATGGVSWEGKNPNTSPQFRNSPIGYDYVKTMDLHLVAGRDLSKDFASDSAGYLVNEAAIKVIGYKDPVGKPLEQWGVKGKIVGVLKDYNFSSMHGPILPLILRNGENESWGNILVRTEAGKTKQALNSLEKVWKSINPKFPFTYSFANENFNRLYKSEQMVSKLSGYFAFLGIFICCLGLLGLTMFTVEQRTREIGIRKVLGASVISLFALLSRQFIVLVLLALLVAAPFAYWAMDNWLQNFAYRVGIEWWVFALAALGMIAIALITVSFQSIRAVFMNPVKSLRSE